MLGEGRNRIVFDQNGRALKVASNPRGIESNKREVALSGKHPALNPVLEHAPDFEWVAAPKVSTLDDRTLAAEVGLPSNSSFEYHMQDWYQGRAKPLTDPRWQEFEDSLNSLRDVVPDLDDFNHAGQWGRTVDGKRVLLDYGDKGLTREQAADIYGFDLSKQYRKPAVAGPDPQRDLPGIAVPEFNYHATPKSNATSIADLGLRPEHGGKNFAFNKNKGRVYMSGQDDADMWAQKLKDFSGEEPLRLRTTAPAQQVPGAAEGVKIRTEPVAPERVQYRNPEGLWRSIKELRPELPESIKNNPDQLKWWAALLGLGSAASDGN